MGFRVFFQLINIAAINTPSFRQGLPESSSQGCERLQLRQKIEIRLFLNALCDADAIHGIWIPAIPAGMTCILEITILINVLPYIFSKRP
jgi:hypothetical protein